MTTTVNTKAAITFSLAGAGIIFNLMLPYLIAATVFMLIDLITGIIKATNTKTLNSRTLGAGVWRKLSLLISIVTGWFIDFTITGLIQSSANFTLPFSMPVGIIISIWVILTEVISIFENLSEVGAPVPAFITKYFKKAKEELDKNEEQ